MTTWDSARKGHVSRREVMDAMGPVVYAARLTDGTVKIGHTEHFGDRLRWLRCYTGQDIELLAFRRGTFEDEQAIHAALVEYRVEITERSREYYSPTPEVMAVVNEMRGELGMPPLAA
jgi:hypothetical protein